jgi:ATP-binding cassette subfamily F protein 3
MTVALDACTALLPGLDPDIFDYIVGILDDETLDAEEMQETVAGFLLSAEFCDSEEEAATKAGELVGACTKTKITASKGPSQSTIKNTRKSIRKKTTNGGGATNVNDAPATTLPAQAATLSIQDDDTAPSVAKEEETPSPAAEAEASSSAAKMEADTQRKTDKLAARIAARDARDARAAKKGKGKKKNAKQTPLEQATAQALEIDAELHEARIAAVRARTQLGAYRGALEAAEFTLPNPGGGRPLLEDAACTLVSGRRYGLIGRNGMGKSTMLRAFAARRVGDVPANVTVHYVSQEVNLTPSQSLKTPVECVVDADIERMLLLEELVILEAKIAEESLDAAGSKRHGDVLSRLEEIGSDSADRRATALLENLGFSPELRSRPLAQLSGGWRVRTMLAAAIFAKPDLLLLDEPTNHLSILAVMWLARELATSETWKERIVVIVSHDRHFMDEVCTDCLHISGAAKRLTQCRGNYSKWAKQRHEQQVLFAKEQAHRKEEIDKLREYAGHGFKYGGSSSQINKMGMKAKQADKLEEIHANHAVDLAALQEDVELPMNIKAGGELDGYMVQLLDVGFGYPDSTPARLFEHCEFGITSKSRIVLLGENGNGKTTLVKLIMGELQPCEGEVRRSPHARYAIVNQHHADQIDLSMTPLQFIAQQYPGDGSYEHMQILRSHLSSCGVTSGSGASKLSPDLQNTPASALSGGQRSRVALAAVSFAKPHVLVLDEPTNNLDLESVAALAESVQEFKGAVICVSHDQFFVQAVANEAWVVNAGKVRQVESFDSYRKKQLRVLNKS